MLPRSSRSVPKLIQYSVVVVCVGWPTHARQWFPVWCSEFNPLPCWGLGHYSSSGHCTHPALTPTPSSSPLSLAPLPLLFSLSLQLYPLSLTLLHLTHPHPLSPPSTLPRHRLHNARGRALISQGKRVLDGKTGQLLPPHHRQRKAGKVLPQTEAPRRIQGGQHFRGLSVFNIEWQWSICLITLNGSGLSVNPS